MKPLAVVLLAILTAACDAAPNAPTARPIDQHAGVPVRVELSALPGVGAGGGTAAISARVSDGLSTALANVPVTFSTEIGTLSASTVSTAPDGTASVLLASTAGTVEVKAAAGDIRTSVLVTVQPQILPVVPPPSTPPPAPNVPAPTPPDAFGTLTVTLRADAIPAQAGRPVQFSMTSPSRIMQAVWRFGDGTSRASGASVLTMSHAYAIAGDYYANVAVLDEHGRTSADTIHVIVNAPLTFP